MPLPSLLLLALALLLAALAVRGRWMQRRIERVTSERLMRSTDGIIVGAEAIDLPVRDGAAGVLLIHGFGDTTQTLRYLAEALHARGYGVVAPLLPGHGRTLQAFAASRAEEWLAEARGALQELRERYERVAIVGLSMGGALAALLAAEADDLPALVLIAPYLGAPPMLRALATAHPLVALTSPWMAGRNTRSILDPAERDLSRAYRAATPRLLRELVTIANRAGAALPRVRAPTLLLQSRQDNRIAPAVAERAVAALGSREKRLEWIEEGGHVLTVDYGRDRVFALVTDWLDRHLHRLPVRATERQV